MDHSSMYFFGKAFFYFCRLFLNLGMLGFLLPFLIFSFIVCVPSLLFSLLLSPPHFLTCPVPSCYSPALAFKVFPEWSNLCYLFMIELREGQSCPGAAMGFSDTQLGRQWKDSLVEIAQDWLLENGARENRKVRKLSMGIVERW